MKRIDKTALYSGHFPVLTNLLMTFHDLAENTGEPYVGGDLRLGTIALTHRAISHRAECALS
jgi:hypothetical protein